jgi:GNAT superfamily N-acetyltransferase
MDKTCINWPETTNRFNITPQTKGISKCTIVCNCSACGCQFEIKYARLYSRKYNFCNECLYKKLSELSKAQWTQEYRDTIGKVYTSQKFKSKMRAIANTEWTDDKKAKASINTKQKWTDTTYRANHIKTSKSAAYKSKVSDISTKMWQNKDFVAKMRKIFDTDEYKHASSLGRKAITKEAATIYKSEEFAAKCREITNKRWLDADYRSKHKQAVNSDECKAKHSTISIKQWQNKAYRLKMQKALRRLWKNKAFRDKMAVARANCPKVSSLQEILYSILDDLEVKYYREFNNKADNTECVIGPWNFDCVIPRDNRPTLLIECQGEYWHNLPNKITTDKQKASYITNNFSGQYELKYLWEHEFSCKDKILETLKYWLGISALEQIDFDLNDISIKISPPSDYKPLLGKYHYLPNAGRGGIAYGAYFANELIAVCVFSPLGRQNITIQDYAKNEVRELSRLCIHPKYRKKNILSWFVSSCIKMLDKKYKCVISYCDTTYNHTGAIYKACNFKLDSEILPDYWYISDGGWVMHKRTLYGRAVRMCMTETQYAMLQNYHKVYGGKKLRFVYKR